MMVSSQECSHTSENFYLSLYVPLLFQKSSNQLLVSHKNRIFASQKDNDIMNIKNIHLVYYSATFSTRRVVREIASQFQKPVKEYGSS